MSVQTFSVSETPLSIGCYRRRIAFRGDECIFTHENLIKNKDGAEIAKLNSKVFDIITRDDKLYALTAKGDVAAVGSDLMEDNKQNNGLFAGIESTLNFIATAHDASHTIRFVDPATLQTVSSVTLPGYIGAFTVAKDDCVLVGTDRSINIIDPREINEILKSNLLPSAPSVISLINEKMIVSCEDRRVRIFDYKKMKAPIATTKPCTKNGAIACYSKDTKDIICVGCDESMTMTDTSANVGQLKSIKYLAESPWISSFISYNDTLNLLTRNGVVHQFTNIVDYMHSLKPDEGNVDNDD